jgi:transcriptional regulator GlxA family with amidase domain
MDRRLELAHQIITTTNLRIKNISTICGFVSFSHFVATFRQRYGITPARLRHSISRQKSIPLHIPEHQ